MMDLSRGLWRKSSYSADETNCVEVAGLDHLVAVRDPKDSAGPALAFGPDHWAAFVATIKQGRLGL